MLVACESRVVLWSALLVFFGCSNVGAQSLFGGSRPIKISETGECSINIGVLHSQLPTTINCNNVSKEVLDRLLLLALTSGWESTVIGDFELYLPDTWRQVDDDMNGQFEAYPRAGTAFSENQLELYVPYGVGGYASDRSKLGWDEDQFARHIGDVGAYHLALSEETYSAMIRSRLYVEGVISEVVNTDNDALRISYDDAMNYMSENSHVVRIGGYPYCEGGNFVPDATLAVFESIIPEEAGSRLTYSLYIDRLSHFPRNFEGFGNWRPQSEVFSQFGRNYIFDFDNRPYPLSISCSGLEIIPGDVYTICSRILQQASINNSGQFSC